MAQPWVNGGATGQLNSIELSLVMLGLCLAVFLTGMDQTILATATPIISNEFNALDDIAWWSNAYLLTLSSFQLFYGKLYSLFSIKLVYLTAIALFEVGSLICTTAPNSVALIIGRAIAGLGAAGVFSGGILITTMLIPLSRRAAYLGVMSGAFGLAAIIGPFLGGALTDRTTWRWCFGINLPLGAVTIILCAVLVHTPKQSDIQAIGLVDKFKQLDIPGTVCMVGSLICLLMALQWGGSTYPWNSSRVIVLFVVFGVLLILFLVSQATSITGKSRTIPVSVLRNRDIWLAASYAMCITGGVYVAILYLPVWFQAVRGSSAFSSGTLLTPLIGGYVVASIIAGGVTSAIGYYNPGLIIGTILSIAGAALITTINMDSSISKIIGYQLLYGFGVGFGFGQPSYVVQTLLPPSDVPVGVTFITLMQNLSASIFVAVGQSILQGELRSRLKPVLPDVDIQSLLDSGAENFGSTLAPEDRQKAIAVYSKCLILTLYISLALSCVSVFGAMGIRWHSMKKTNDQTTDDSANRPSGEQGISVARDDGDHVQIPPSDKETLEGAK
ncbi:major facilitator superfamily domain-containing protein [Annulohypoxylon maeteangense]|uniref:major facilitator superfamily domain-containing protein n=1 Tax=Annulohypoxylon maeteangense TaxID=1927788 RepID=UPI002007CCCD|nr:major facilitator superfamily domain-containing protein [Annulohypoxylon maeteangense]KAI0883505.1 major facilitator superfamily domain-containing protein [Annulohypoxylon maeteangense]